MTLAECIAAHDARQQPTPINERVGSTTPRGIALLAVYRLKDHLAQLDDEDLAFALDVLNELMDHR